MNPRIRFKGTDLLIGIIFTLLFISIGVVITINFRPLYYLDVNLLNIDTSSGYDKKEILQNYNTLIDYCSPIYQGELKFPTLKASANGLEHFREVKSIFIFFYILGAVTLVAAILIMIFKSKRRDYSYLLTSSITAVALPLILGCIMAVNFDTVFITFHKLVFNNNYWLFDPATDPVINILPETFFLHCALLIIIIIILLSIALFLYYRKKRRRMHIKYRMTKGLKL